MENSFAGESIGKPSAPGQPDAPGAPGGYDANGVQANPFAGLGYVLETTDDKQIFEHIHGLVLRTELLAQNRLAYDTHWAYFVTGYPWSELEKLPGKDQYIHRLPYGSVSTQAVPNKAWDLVNKTAETLLVDFPKAEAQPRDSSEEAQAACDVANRFLAQDAGELGTNDEQFFYDRVQRALFTPTSFAECWTDPTGAGYVPLQINAHPGAQDPNSPMVDAQGNPTTDYVLRYVTEAPTEGPDGTPVFPEGTQFTDDPSEAAPLWLPRLRAAKWNREHVRVFPETARVEDAEKVIILGYCTIGEARRRWQTVAEMQDADLESLCDWTPPRYLHLLPPYLRSRWKLTDGRKERQGSGDERLIFYYHIYIKACSDYRKGADVVVSGVGGGRVLDKRLLSKPVTVDVGGMSKTEVRCMEIPVMQLTPVADPFDMDPQGRAFIEIFAGAVENNANLAMSFQQLVDRIVRTPYTVASTSPVTGEMVKNARATEDFILIRNPQDKPTPIVPAALPESAFFQMFNLSDDSINSAASQNRPAQGSDRQQEVSGRAREIAVQQNNLANTSKSNVVNAAYARWCRIKLERAMADFETQQLILYVGEDGATKVREWTGVDFALVGKVEILAGTGTMMTPDMKVQYIGNLQAASLMDGAEAAEAARPSYAKRLGLGPDRHAQYVERCIAAWNRYLKTPPTPTWVQEYQAWQQAQAAYQQALAQFQQQQQMWQQAVEARALSAGGPPPVALGPEQQNAQAMDQYQQAVLWLQLNPQAAAMTAPPVQPPPPQVPMPWTPFADRPNDTEPAIAATWTRKLSLVISSTKYEEASPEWRDVLVRKYNAMRQAVATASGAAPASTPNAAPQGTPSAPAAKQSPQFPGPRPAPGSSSAGSQHHPGAASRGAVNQHTPTAARVAA